MTDERMALIELIEKQADEPFVVLLFSPSTRASAGDSVRCFSR
jgi:hypothetical protein